MFAVSHDTHVTLWDADSNQLVNVFDVTKLETCSALCFAGLGGSYLIAGGKSGIIGWDLLTFQGQYLPAKCDSFECLYLCL